MKSRGFFNRSKNVQALRAKLREQKAIPVYNEAAARKALRNYLATAVKPRYNKALVNAMLRLPDLNEATKQTLIRSQQSRGRFAGTLGSLGAALVRGIGSLGRGNKNSTPNMGPFRLLSVIGVGLSRKSNDELKKLLNNGTQKYNYRIAVAKEILKRKNSPHRQAALNFINANYNKALTEQDILVRIQRLFDIFTVTTDPRRKAAIVSQVLIDLRQLKDSRNISSLNALLRGKVNTSINKQLNTMKSSTSTKTFIPVSKNKPPPPPPLGYVLKEGPDGFGYYRNNKALQSQLERRVGPGYRNRGSSAGSGTGTGIGGGGGIIFKPQISVGAARIGAQTFGGTRVGGQQMGSQRTSTGNVAGARTGGIEVGGPRAATGNVGGARTGGAATGNVGGARTNGNVGVTSEQLIRAGGGSEAIEKGINALRQTGGNAAKASAISRLPMNTFTNIYAMGGPVAAKRLVESRRRRRRVTKKKPVKSKPRKQYIKLTPYQFKRLTDHIKKNNLRKVLIKEITH